MITTSSYRLAEDLPHSVSISRIPPDYWDKRTRWFKPFAPEYQLWKKFMIHDDEEKFRWEFTCQLRKLDPQAIINQLHPDAILLCWELREEIYPFKPLICHRQLVAKWLSSHIGYDVKELE